jgi:hypothetical protein
MKGKEFKTISKFTPSPRISKETKFSLRLIAYPEFGMIINWDIIFNGILQCSTAVDIGFRPELQIGTNVDALAITPPYFYTLDKLAIKAFLRVRAQVGLNNAITGFFRKIVSIIPDPSYKFVKMERLVIPDIVLPPNNVPAPLQLALNQAVNNSMFGNATFISLEQLNALVPDPFPKSIGTPIQGLDLDFGFKFQIFADNFTVLGAPNITLVASQPAQLCQGQNAIVLTVATRISRALIPLRNGVKDGFWYANFDGRVLKEDTAWVLDPVRTNINSITMTLPRSAINRPGFTNYEITNKSSIILRATPEILPVPERSLFVKSELNNLFNVPKFECCEDSDCRLLYNDRPFCFDDKRCGQIIVQ